MNFDRNLEFYKLIFDYSLDAILLTTPEGKVHRANDSACKMFDMTEKEIISLGRYGLVDPSDPRLEEAIRYREQYGYVKAELTFLRRNQIPFPAMITSSIFKDKRKKLWSVMIIRDLTESKEIENNLRQAKAENEIMANHDFLTGLLNRRGFMKKVEEMMADVSDSYDFGLLLIDIDYFKEFNDKHGHIKGDCILKDFADYLKQSLIELDALVGRFGGDEFIVFFRNTSEFDLNNIAENIRSKVEHMDFTSETEEINLTISIGVTIFPKGIDIDNDDIISFADANMYRAKKVRNSIYYKKIDITTKDL
ncbi:MAG: sensor domain-containing diguanylate cyclase [Candidatus Izemoplasmatales bacterium]|nr:sensor domain-containing diguanylate cyclase [Candidatus Izemoplasmatales bacterium]